MAHAELLSNLSSKLESVPPHHCVPLHERPDTIVEIADSTIPVIDLGKANKAEERPAIVEQIMKAFEEYGFFQVINHGVSENLMEEAMKVTDEFFNMSAEEKANYTKDAAQKSARGEATLYNGSSTHYDTEVYRCWRDVLEHSANADKKDRVFWPDNPPRYREVIGEYSDEVRKLSKVILGLVAEGLGLEGGFFDKDFGQRMLVNYYPACPDPSKTLGVGGHCDPNLITVLQQNVYGLQILKDGKWLGVEPIPNSFVINSGLPITVISNGKLASVAHRVVTNTTHSRMSIGTFVCPDDFVEPAKQLVGPDNPPQYKSFYWRSEFMPHYLNKKSHISTSVEALNKGIYDTSLDDYKIYA